LNRREQRERSRLQSAVSSVHSCSVFEYDAFGNRKKDVWKPETGTVVTEFAMDGWNPAKGGQRS
jgi:hypothetical protein